MSEENKALNHEHRAMVARLIKPADDIIQHLINNPQQANAWHMGTGVAGEAGELLDAIKKHVVYAKDANIENVIEELGDLEFYMEGIRAHFGIAREQTLQANMEKLLKGKNARYSGGSYSDAAAQLRSDKFTVSQEEVIKFISDSHSTVFTVDDVKYVFSANSVNDYCYYLDAKGNCRQSASITNLGLLEKVKPEWFKE